MAAAAEEAEYSKPTIREKIICSSGVSGVRGLEPALGHIRLSAEMQLQNRKKVLESSLTCIIDEIGTYATKLKNRARHIKRREAHASVKGTTLSTHLLGIC